MSHGVGSKRSSRLWERERGGKQLFDPQQRLSSLLLLSLSCSLYLSFASFANAAVVSFLEDDDGVKGGGPPRAAKYSGVAANNPEDDEEEGTPSSFSARAAVPAAVGELTNCCTMFEVAAVAVIVEECVS